MTFYLTSKRFHFNFNGRRLRLFSPFLGQRTPVLFYQEHSKQRLQQLKFSSLYTDNTTLRNRLIRIGFTGQLR